MKRDVEMHCCVQGERNYAAIEGDTGPIVYPAGHLYSYTLLYWLTGHGQVSLAQPIFAVLYLATQVTLPTLTHASPGRNPCPDTSMLSFGQAEHMHQWYRKMALLWLSVLSGL